MLVAPNWTTKELPDDVSVEAASPWEVYEQPLFRRKIKSLDGTKLKDRSIMRRLVQGVWQYRRMADDEAVAYGEKMMREQEDLCW